jgi:asparagine N-glycosylation enzyme membrane subunit Stt3
MDRLFFYHALLFGSCGYALLRGKADARIVALVFLAGNFATYALRSPQQIVYSSVESGILAVDVLALLGFTYVALTSDRFWPLWVSGLQLITTFGHAMKALQSDLMPIAYAAALRFWSYPILIILCVAVWRGQRRSRRQRESMAA